MNHCQKIVTQISSINFFNESSPAGYAKMLINVKNPDKSKETVAEIKDKISDSKDRIKK